MRVDYKFRHISHSTDLTTYVSERLPRLEKFELKPVHIEVTFSEEKTSKRVDFHLRGDHLDMHAHGEAETFFASVDEALDKLARQLAKKKARVQAHKPKVS